MNQLPPFSIWHILGTHLPEIQARIQGVAPIHAKLDPVLPQSYEPLIRASGIEKAWNEYFIRYYSPDKSVLVLPIEGEMSRNSYWNWGNEFLMRQLNAAAQDPEIKGAVLRFYTPGGTADSTPAFAQTVANFRKVKPILAQTGFCYSAGYFVASQCNEIYVEDQAAGGVGSIGTLLIRENYAEWLEAQKIEMEIMRAEGSEDKALVNWIEKLSEQARGQLQASLNACQREFVGFVKRGRAGKIKSDEVFTGKTYNATEAISMGLADAKGDLFTAVKRVLALAA